MTKIATASLLILVFAGLSIAQGPPMPQLTPEHKRLQYFAGTWKSDLDMKPSPMGPGGKASTTDVNEMFPGDFFLTLKSDGTMPGMGTMHSLALMGYDPAKKIYTYYSIDNLGMQERSTGTVNGDTWVWNSEPSASMPMKGRFTIKEISAKEYSFKYDMSQDGNTWTTVMEGKSTKVK
ncbi:MAG TPA: DUF1579 family protein [Terriglobales bacterium]|nr:DUF1579 family protein [Terriglobales bacterium]